MTKIPLKAASSHSETEFVVLLASPRSGTHLLKSILTTVPGIEDAGECFHPTDFGKPKHELNFWHYLRGHGLLSELSPLTNKQREAHWRTYLSFLATNIKGEIGILDFKYNMLRTADVGYLWPEEAPTMLRLAIKDRMPIIHLKRRNHLEVICSLQHALKTGEWVRPRDKKQSKEKPTTAASVYINPANLLSMLAAMQRRDALVDSWLTGYGRHIEIDYEDLLFEGRISGLILAGIEQLLNRKLDLSPKPRTLKMSPPLSRFIENYDEVESKLAGTQYARFLLQRSKPRNALLGSTGPDSVTINNDAQNQGVYHAANILSLQPLTMLLSEGAHLDGFNALVTEAPEIFDAKQALHLLHLRHSLETGRAHELACSIAKVQRLFPHHIFLPLTATDYETYLLAQEGVPSLVASGLIFHDEKVWRPRADLIDGLPKFDAIYVARLNSEKRHELAREIDSLSLVYGPSISQRHADAYERVRNVLPKAFFANHRLSDGGKLDHDTLCRLLAHARVGLCLSAEEGCMRASIEYLLAGLPVVSTPSIGGRDRYFAAPYCRIVEATPNSIAKAVHDLAGKNLDRQRIRQHVAQMVGFDRYNFLLNVNKIAKFHFGKEDLISGFSPMIGKITTCGPTSQVVASLRAEFADLQKTLSI